MMLLENFAENTNGYFSLKTAAESGITRWQVQELLRNGKIQKVSYGLYALKNVIPDELFITQLLCPKAVFSHESALFFNGYSDQVPFRYTVSVPHGYVSKSLSEQYDVRHVSKESAEEGIAIIKSDLGNDLRVYCIERTLCELLHKPSDLDKERFIPAIQKYLRSKNKDILTLMHFAKIFRVEKRLLPYLEAVQ
ncbi:MAG: type IV toxin-antitoxin system AbiEi family antitoxin domain-containing protein [Treponema sp.]|nr:type IV toxin-antitoxin system AbiEi family antitoxin domain-containing protein [Treponema sp.]